jgi:hypothetical protein
LLVCVLAHQQRAQCGIASALVGAPAKSSLVLACATHAGVLPRTPALDGKRRGGLLVSRLATEIEHARLVVLGSVATMTKRTT